MIFPQGGVGSIYEYNMQKAHYARAIATKDPNAESWQHRHQNASLPQPQAVKSRSIHGTNRERGKFQREGEGTRDSTCNA
jgi:hypothetical protein